MRLRPRAWLAGLGFAALSACALTDPPDVGGLLPESCHNFDSLPSFPVSFATNIQPLLNRPVGGCSPCHIGAAVNGLDLSSLATLRQGGFTFSNKILVKDKPCDSILYQKLSESPPASTARMPLGGPYFSESELQLVHDWIAEGAQDN